MAYKAKPTDAQAKILDDADAALAKLMQDTRGKLEASDFRFSDGDFSCRVCGCEHFTGRPGRPCQTPECGHGFTRHNVY
jgi:hypothetical protein